MTLELTAPGPSGTTLHFGAEHAGAGAGRPLALCLHGFPDHRRTFRHLLPALAAAGFHAVAPDLRGYAPTCQPADGDYGVARVARDVVAWLDQLSGPPALLVGHDWGALISYAVAALAPERLAGLATLAIPPLRRIPDMLRARPMALANLWYIALFQLPGLPERALLAGDAALLRRLWRSWSPGWTCPAAELDRVVETFRRPGVARAALGYYRSLRRLDTPAGRESWRLSTAPLRVPTLLLTGARDGCIDSQLYEAAMRRGDLPEGSAFHRLPDAGHFLHLEQPAAVHKLLIPWLQRRAP
jgi:pimeloyl-ACP methyl ester carboxylesterase